MTSALALSTATYLFVRLLRPRASRSLCSSTRHEIVPRLVILLSLTPHFELGKSSCSSLPSLQACAKPREAWNGNSEIHLCTSTVPSSVRLQRLGRVLSQLPGLRFLLHAETSNPSISLGSTAARSAVNSFDTPKKGACYATPGPQCIVCVDVVRFSRVPCLSSCCWFGWRYRDDRGSGCFAVLVWETRPRVTFTVAAVASCSSHWTGRAV